MMDPFIVAATLPDSASLHRVRWALEHPQEYEHWRQEHPPESSFWRSVWEFLKEVW